MVKIMTGTASVFGEEMNPAERQQRLFSRLTDWVFGHNDVVYKEGVLVDISECGGALLLSKNFEMPNDIFDLIILESDDCDITPTTVRAVLRWSDLDYSGEHIKIGFEFEKGSSFKLRAIKALIDYSKMKKEMRVKCSLVF